MSNNRPPLPPFNFESAVQKVRQAEDAWNTRDPDRVALAYTEDSRWRNRAEFFQGRKAIVEFLKRRWARELDYRLIKELWAFHENRISVRFQYEWHDDSGSWFRAYGNEQWEFDANGLMRRREGSINDVPILASDRKFQWPAGPRPAGHSGLTELGAIGLAIATAIVGAPALVQYIKAERWKRLEFAVTQIDKLMRDPSLAFCRQVIDWDCGPLIIPEKYICLFPPGQRVIEHDRVLLARALRPDPEDALQTQEHKPELLLYRRTFEEFFSYVDAVAMYRDLGIVKRIDLGPFEYYLSLLREPIPKKGRSESGSIFMDLIGEYYSCRVLPWVLQADRRGVGDNVWVVQVSVFRRGLRYRERYAVRPASLCDFAWY